MKLACSVETSAPPSRHPLAPASSISRAAVVARRVPKARAGVGQRDRLRLLAADEARLHFAADLGSARARELQHDARDDDVARERRMSVEVPHAGRVRLGPARATAPKLRGRTRRSRDRYRRSCAATRRSSRESRRAIRCLRRPADAAFAVTSAMSADPPASTRTLASSLRTRTAAKSPPSRITMPRTPPSPTSTLLPAADDPPRHPAPQAEAHQLRQLRLVRTVAKASAGPPIFHEVYGASGSSKRARSPKISRSDSRSPSSSSERSARAVVRLTRAGTRRAMAPAAIALC